MISREVRQFIWSLVFSDKGCVISSYSLNFQYSFGYLTLWQGKSLDGEVGGVGTYSRPLLATPHME